MERRDFFKATVVAVGLAACGRDTLQVSDPATSAPAKPRFSTQDDGRRSLVAQLGFPPEDRESELALIYLGEDILFDPAIAERFYADPSAYIAWLGLAGASLERNSAEVAAVLVLAHDDVSAPLLKGDTGAALAAMEARDVFDPSRQSEFAREGETPLQADVKAALRGDRLEPPAALSEEAKKVTELAMAAVGGLEVYRSQDALTDAQVRVLIERALVRYGVN